METVKLESKLPCSCLFFNDSSCCVRVRSRGLGGRDRNVDTRTSGEGAAILRESIQVAQTRIVVIGVEKNEKFGLYFSGRENKTYFVLDGGGMRKNQI